MLVLSNMILLMLSCGWTRTRGPSLPGDQRESNTCSTVHGVAKPTWSEEKLDSMWLKIFFNISKAPTQVRVFIHSYLQTYTHIFIYIHPHIYTFTYSHDCANSIVSSFLNVYFYFQLCISVWVCACVCRCPSRPEPLIPGKLWSCGRAVYALNC